MAKRWLAGVGLVLIVALAVFLYGYYSGSSQQEILEVTGSSDSSVTGSLDLSEVDSSITGAVTAGCENSCWTKTYNDPLFLNEGFNDVVVDSDLNTWVTGYRQVSGVVYNVLLRKYDSCGNLKASIEPIMVGLGGRESGELSREGLKSNLVTDGSALELSDFNTLYVTGHYKATGTNRFDIWVARYDYLRRPEGPSRTWINYFRSTDDDYAYGIAVEPSTGLVYVVGEQRYTLPSSGVQAKPLILAFRSGGGALAWNKTVHPWSWGSSMSFANDAETVPGDSGVYVVGTADRKLWAAKYNSNGSLAWNRTYLTSTTGVINGVDYDMRTGKLAFAGNFPSNSYIYSLVSPTSVYPFWAEIEPATGVMLYNYYLSDTYGRGSLEDIETMGSGNVFVTGAKIMGGWFYGGFNATTNFDVYTGRFINTTNNTDPLFHYLANAWSATYNGGRSYLRDAGKGIAVDSLNNSYVAGKIGQLGGVETDAFLRKYTAAGLSCG